MDKKKNFAGAAKANADVFNTIASGGQSATPATPATSSPQTALDAEAAYDTPNISAISDTVKASATRATSVPFSERLTPPVPLKETHYVKFNLRMPEEMKAYLERAAFARSTPEHIVSVTQYLCDLIQEDMERNGQGE